MSKPREKTVERWKVSKLKPYPRQAEFFNDLSDHDLQLLADDIKRNGLKQPIEILSDGTILRGHQRCRALRLLGRNYADVIVRRDLDGADDAVIEREFLEDNQNRRQLSPLAKARVAARLVELEKNKPSKRMRNRDQEEFRDRVGKAINMSGRNLSRYLRVLQTPMEVQNAFDAGQLALVVAERVADLSQSIQTKIAERLRNGEVSRQVVLEYLPKKPPLKRHADWTTADLAKNLHTAVDELAERLNEVSSAVVIRHRRDLRKGRTLIKSLLARATPSAGADG